MSLYPLQSDPFSLAGSGSSIGDTFLNLKSFKDINGVVIAMANLGTIAYMTIEPGNGSNEEQISFTGVTQNADGSAQLTGIKTVLFKTPYTETSGFAKTHAGSTEAVLSNTAGFYNQFGILANDETVTGQWTFNSFPITPSNSDASTTVKGVTKLSTSPASGTNPIAVGTNDTRMPTADPTTLFAPLLIIPTGGIIPYAATSAPTGYLLCDGSAVSRATYATLFGVISTTYGAGDTSTTFNVPDLTSRGIVGRGTGSKVMTFASRSSNNITVTGLSTNTGTNENQTGVPVTYHTTGSVITGLSNDTVYYLIKNSNNAAVFNLATSLANAQTGTFISLSGDGTGTQTFTIAYSTRALAETGGEETITLSTVAGAIAQAGTSGSNGAINNMAPFLTVTYLIKY